MRFKKIYIEITNICNMNCSFCPPHNREKRFMSKNEFETILNKIKPYTKYIYLHVKGEPMLHPNFDELVKLAYDKGFFVNITTNGTLLQNHLEVTKYIRQINISLHSENKQENYLENIINCINKLRNKIIVLRYWTLNDEKSPIIVDKVLEYFNITNIDKHIKLRDNLYLDKQEEFVWPNLKNDYYNEIGTCYALKDQIAILVDGTVVPCCLDSDGVINLGNIFDTTLEEIMNSKRYIKMKTVFCNRKVTEELCKKCSFKDRLLTNK